MAETELVGEPPQVRRAGASDAAKIAVIHRSAFRRALPHIRELHTPVDDLAYFAGVIDDQQVYVASIATQYAHGEVAGFVAFAPCWVNHLYVAPEHQRTGIGMRLLNVAKSWHAESQSADALTLWTFQRNTAARNFYLTQDFVPIRFTSGSHNEEQEPDILFSWRPSRDGASGKETG